MRKFVCVFAFLLSGSAGSTLLGQADESRIRSDAGGLYQSPAFGRGSVSGLPSDVVIFKDPAGHILAQRSVFDWANPIIAAIFPPPPNPVIDVITNSGGMLTLRFGYLVQSKLYPTLPGGTVEVVRSGCVVDRDRLYR